MKDKIVKIWRDKLKILSGLFTSLFGNNAQRKIAQERQRICKSNRCGFYDAKGVSPKAFIKGKPACEICGCNIKLLTNSMESQCSLTELGKEPLWKSNG